MVNVQNALKRVEYKLPKEVTDQGIKIKKRSSDILGFFAFRSTSMSSLELNNFVKTRVKDEVARVPGISAVNLMPEKYQHAHLAGRPAHVRPEYHAG